MTRFRIRALAEDEYGTVVKQTGFLGYDPELTGVEESYDVLAELEREIRCRSLRYSFEVYSIDNIFLGVTSLKGNRYTWERGWRDDDFLRRELLPLNAEVLDIILAENGAWRIYNRILPRGIEFRKRYFTRTGDHVLDIRNETGDTGFYVMTRWKNGLLYAEFPYLNTTCCISGNIPVCFGRVSAGYSLSQWRENLSASFYMAVKLGDELDGECEK